LLTASFALANSQRCSTQSKFLKLAGAMKLSSMQDNLMTLAEKKKPCKKTKHPDGLIHVPTYWHMVFNETHGEIPSKQIKEQFKVLNQIYKKVGFKFDLIAVNPFMNPLVFNMSCDQLFCEPDCENFYFKKILAPLKVGGMNTLNIYSLSEETIGISTNPQFKLELDFVINAYTTVPGGTSVWNLGKNLVHEVGHWLGLFHTFDYDYDIKTNSWNEELPLCAENDHLHGDLISDTQPEYNPADFDCTKKHDCIKIKGKWMTVEEANVTVTDYPDDVTNYMNFGGDHCMTHFTKRQVTAMHKIWEEYRCPK